MLFVVKSESYKLVSSIKLKHIFELNDEVTQRNVKNTGCQILLKTKPKLKFTTNNKQQTTNNKQLTVVHWQTGMY